MDALELLEIVERGEDSQHQFKRNITNETSMATELAAFSNSRGGLLIIGVDDDGTIAGLSNEDIGRLNNMISNASSSHIRNPINPTNENIKLEDGLVMVVTVSEGFDKPYITNEGAIWVRSGADKRKVTSKEELRRLFSESDLLHAGEIPISDSTINDIDEDFFDEFYQDVYDRSLDDEEKPLLQLIQNMNLAKEDHLNLAGLLLFGENPQKYKPQFIVKAVYFDGNEPTSDKYFDSEDIGGRLSNQYVMALAFLKRNLVREQNGQGRNTTGELEIPEIVLEELLVNAIIHRNYFIDAPIRVFMFENRVEIISPGVLPNHMTEENAKSGVSIQRNPVISSFVTKAKPPIGLPYRGIGTGIQRAYKEFSEIELFNDQDNNQFIVTINRTN
ncbi:MAG: putative DNA binding domain-containing protein [Balneolaceae bacterium]|nr:putative DNA binding domain-containing protein [Balneolaceae bacterium]